MSLKFKSLAVVSALVGALALAGCGEKEKIPIISVWGLFLVLNNKLLKLLKQVAKDKYGLNVELVTFNDFVMPNESLSRGDIDINAFQHKPYLDQQIKRS